jgi:hypothetical protein
MPETLTFGSSCTIGLIGGTCGVDQQTNIVTVNDITNVTLPEDVLIKMVVQPGTNPPGARDCGGWSIQTQIQAGDSTWYTVDKAVSP